MVGGAGMPPVPTLRGHRPLTAHQRHRQSRLSQSVEVTVGMGAKRPMLLSPGKALRRGDAEESQRHAGHLRVRLLDEGGQDMPHRLVSADRPLTHEVFTASERTAWAHRGPKSLVKLGLPRSVALKMVAERYRQRAEGEEGESESGAAAWPDLS